jgi:hypothetical protein
LIISLIPVVRILQPKNDIASIRRDLPEARVEQLAVLQHLLEQFALRFVCRRKLHADQRALGEMAN